MNDINQPSPFTEILSVEAALDLIDRGIPISEILRTYPNAAAETRGALMLIESLERERDRLLPPRKLLHSILTAPPAYLATKSLLAWLSKFRLPLFMGVPIVAFAAIAFFLGNTVITPSPNLPPRSETARQRSSLEESPVGPANLTNIPSSAITLRAENPIDGVVSSAIQESGVESASAVTERDAELGALDEDALIASEFSGISGTVDISSSFMNALEFCKRVTSTAAIFSDRIAVLVDEGNIRLANRTMRVGDSRIRVDANRATARASADAARLDALDQLIQEAPTTSERAALQTFRNTITAALRVSRASVSGARSAFQLAFDEVLAAREAKYRSARTKFSNDTTAAFTAATKSCARNPKSSGARDTARTVLLEAEKQFFISTSITADAVLAAVIQSNGDVLQRAGEQLDADVRVAQGRLRESLHE